MLQCTYETTWASSFTDNLGNVRVDVILRRELRRVTTDVLLTFWLIDSYPVDMHLNRKLKMFNIDVAKVRRHA